MSPYKYDQQDSSWTDFLALVSLGGRIPYYTLYIVMGNRIMYFILYSKPCAVSESVNNNNCNTSRVPRQTSFIKLASSRARHHCDARHDSELNPNRHGSSRVAMAIADVVIKRNWNIKTKNHPLPLQKKMYLRIVIVIQRTDERELRPTATAGLPQAEIIGTATCIFTVVVRKRNGKTPGAYDF